MSHSPSGKGNWLDPELTVDSDQLFALIGFKRLAALAHDDPVNLRLFGPDTKTCQGLLPASVVN